jgi:hypothetical protein
MLCPMHEARSISFEVGHAVVVFRVLQALLDCLLLDLPHVPIALTFSSSGLPDSASRCCLIATTAFLPHLKCPAACGYCSRYNVCAIFGFLLWPLGGWVCNLNHGQGRMVFLNYKKQEQMKQHKEWSLRMFGT